MSVFAIAASVWHAPPAARLQYMTRVRRRSGPLCVVRKEHTNDSMAERRRATSVRTLAKKYHLTVAKNM